MSDGLKLELIRSLLPKSYLAERFPDYEFEDGFSEEDPWWKPGTYPLPWLCILSDILTYGM